MQSRMFFPKRRHVVATALIAAVVWHARLSGVDASSQPIRARHGMVASQKMLASEAGLAMLERGGNAVDAAVATAFALAVTLPRAGNIGGGGFMVLRLANGEAAAYDFRESAPTKAHPAMFLKDGEYDWDLHHNSGRSVGIPGTVAGLHLAWQEHGKLPWKTLLEPAIVLAKDGIRVTEDMESSFQTLLGSWTPHPATTAKLTHDKKPYRVGEQFVQPELARTLSRIAEHGPKDFYHGETARLIVDEMKRIDGWITMEDLANYRPIRRDPVRGNYRGHEIISMPPPSSGGVALIQMLNILEDFDIAGSGVQSSKNLHLMAESMRRAFSDRARYLGDADFNPELPLERLVSKDYARQLARGINPSKASESVLDELTWSSEHPETTHFSVADAERNAVSVTYTIERPMTVVTGAGFLLNSELGDFNAGPDVTNDQGLIGTPPNLAAAGKRPLSSMTPSIVVKDGQLFMVTGTPGGRTIINTVLQTILNVVDHDMNAQQAIDAPRIHHQWFPDQIRYEGKTLSVDVIEKLQSWGHRTEAVEAIGCAQVIVFHSESGFLEGGSDQRRADGGVAAY